MPAKTGSTRRNEARMKCAQCLYRVGIGVKDIAKLLGIGGHNSVKRMLQRSKIYGTREVKYRGAVVIGKKNKAKYAQKRVEDFRTFRPGGQLKFGFLKRTATEAIVERYHNDKAYNLKSRLAKRLRQVFDRGHYGKRTAFFIGCSMKHLIQHMESQFEPGMTWANKREWHIDHMLPCRSFDLSNIYHAMMCFNWRNLRPMWGADNIRKKDKYSKSKWNQYVKQFKNGFWIGNGCISTGSREARVAHTNSNPGQ